MIDSFWMNFKLWKLRKLINYFCEYGIENDNHIIADNVIIMHDAANEIEKIINRS